MAFENSNANEPEFELVKILIDKNYRISFAESCTGGMCSARLVGVPDASKVLDVSFVTYADAAKVKYLGVDAQTISARGVVSEEVAAEMARGVAESAGCEVGVGVTGIAGPTGATEKKPVGMVCFGFCICGKTTVFTKYFGNLGRNAVRKASSDFVYETLLNLLKND